MSQRSAASRRGTSTLPTPRTEGIAALVITGITVKEGRDAWQGKGWYAPTAHSPPALGGSGAVGAVGAVGADACGCEPGCTCHS
ncbi:hypothetical protein [Streptomyces sp. NBC_01020]|uniref:hypothetical protein n=1 Tax=Streptomyces sp. NBC_01020 TaxID=2903722 RepID=UPI003863894F